eukprot:CAMPEP_0174260516 /NCGR_PEP_ID=MMETSP0439-20130205/9811_1 /TAXON_ID=0 /ORGANISM="Stereomyxa ramosa, Strain Chinc5" /LENGTH=472 /DNA_ID=CAMNT_0015344773 /DNA_START=55 /DNA_END=1473 /DNA_ORIENTATION=+
MKAASLLCRNPVHCRTLLPSLQRGFATKEEKLRGLSKKIDTANKKALEIFYKADLVLEDIRPAKELIPAMKDNPRLILVSGPPVTWKQMCGAQKGAVKGMIMLEGWADTPEGAEKLAESGEVTIEPNHAHDSCGPMAGTISPNFPIYAVRNQAFGNVAFSRPADLAQQFGDFNHLEDVRWWQEGVAPHLSKALRNCGGLPLNEIHKLALEMGDESHNRNNAFTALFSYDLTTEMIKAGVPNDNILAIMDWFNYKTWNSQSGVRACLGLVMASAKATLDPAKGIPYSTFVTCMARNGYEFGIKIADSGDTWYSAPSPFPEGKFFPPYKQTDAGRDMGDSAITEANGWGSNVLNGALAFLNGLPATVQRAHEITAENKSLMVGRNPYLKAPAYDFEGVPQGLDFRLVHTKKLLPWINTGITHRDAGHRVIGRGLSKPPQRCFDQALEAMAKKYEVSKGDFLETVQYSTLSRDHF